MELTLQRLRGPHPEQTHGRLRVGHYVLCDTLEDEVREVAGQPVSTWKVPHATAIPVGRYRVKLTFSTRFQKVLPEVLLVPGFTGIRIHAGNTEQDTSGCVLVGFRFDDAVRDSRRTMTTLMAALSATSEPIWLTILAAPTDGPILSTT